MLWRPCVFLLMILLIGDLASGEASLPSILSGLRDSDPAVRRLTARRLATRKSESKQSIPALIASLQDADLGVKQHSVQALGALAPESIHALTAAAKSEPVARRPAIFSALSQLLESEEETSREHLKLIASAILRDGDAATQRAAINVFRRLKEKAAAVTPVFVEQLKRPEQRKLALQTLSALGPGAASAVPAIAPLLNDADYSLVSHAIGALEGIGPAAAPTVPRLLELLKDDRYSDQVFRTLREIGPGAKPAVPELARRLLADFKDASKILSALEKIGPETEAAVPALLEYISKTDGFHERTFAVRVLGAAQTSHLPAIEFLINSVLKKDNSDFHLEASKALNQIKIFPPQYGEKLVQVVQIDTIPAQEAAVRGLGQIGTAAEIHIPALQKIASAPNPKSANSQMYACKALGRIGVKSIPILRELSKQSQNLTGFRGLTGLALAGTEGFQEVVAQLESPDLNQRQRACEVFGSMGAEAADAAAPMLEKSPDIAKDALARIGAPAVPALVAALSSTNIKTRECACEAIERLGVVARAAIPRLVELLDDPKQGVRGCAVNALCSMKEEARPFIPMLIARYHASKGYDRRQYQFAFQHLGPDMRSMLPNFLADPERDEVIGIIARIGTPAHEAMFKELAAGQYKFIEESQWFFKYSETDIGAFDLVLCGMESSQAAARLRSALAAGIIGPFRLYDRDLMKVMRKGIEKLSRDTDVNVRVAAIWSEQRINEPEKKVRDTRKQLFADLQTCAEPIRWYAVCALVWQPDLKSVPEAKTAIPFLKQMVQSDQELARRGARIALEFILEDKPEEEHLAKAEAVKAPNAEVRTDALQRMVVTEQNAYIVLNALGDGNVEVQREAIRRIPNVHKVSPMGLPALLQMLKENNEPLREEIKTALAVIGPDAAPGVLKVLRSSAPDSWDTCLGTFSQMGADAGVTFPELAKMLLDPDTTAQNCAIRALLYISAGCIINEAPPNWTPLIEPLLKTIENPKSEYRHDAALVFGRVRPMTDELLGRLKAIGARNRESQTVVDHGIREILKFAPPEIAAKLPVEGNEAFAIQSCFRTAVAQQEYKETDWDKDGVFCFAPTYRELVAKEVWFVDETFVGAEGPPAPGAIALKGYRFKFLLSQTTAAGKLESFQVKGGLSRYVILAYPVEYEKTGVRTFAVTSDLEILEQDLGVQTPQIISSMQSFKPGPAWKFNHKINLPPKDGTPPAVKPPTDPNF